MTDIESRVYATGHYTLVFIALMFCSAATFVFVHDELHPKPLVEACPAPRPK